MPLMSIVIDNKEIPGNFCDGLPLVPFIFVYLLLQCCCDLTYYCDICQI